MKFVTRAAIAAMLSSLCSFSVISAENNGLAPEVTDLNVEDVSYAKEKLIKYLDKPYISAAPTKLDDGIPVGKLGSDGGDTEKILAFAREIAKGPEDTKHSTDSLLISYKGKLIFESYFRRGRINYPHYQMSITKSYTALALGRAIQLGHFSMEDLKKPVVSFLKYVDKTKLAAGTAEITLDKTMHMGSGIRLDKEKVKELRKTPALLKGQGQVQAYMQHSAPIPKEGVKFKYQASDPAMAMQVVQAVVEGGSDITVGNVGSGALSSPVDPVAYDDLDLSLTALTGRRLFFGVPGPGRYGASPPLGIAAWRQTGQARRSGGSGVWRRSRGLCYSQPGSEAHYRRRTT